MLENQRLYAQPESKNDGELSMSILAGTGAPGKRMIATIRAFQNYSESVAQSQKPVVQSQ